MVALRRFFHAEKTPSTPVSEAREPQTQSPSGRAHKSATSPASSKNEHFQNIERQFEVLHDELKTQPTAPPAHIPLTRASSRLKNNRNPRHVDLFDALYGPNRYQTQSPSAASNATPISPYNEDVAERNMAPFLRPSSGRKRSAYSRILSALYQEDVADRNISQSRRRSRSLSRGTNPLRLKTSHSYQLDYQRPRDDTGGHSRSTSKESPLVNSISQEALYSVPKSFRDQVAADSNASKTAPEGFLRTQRSAPTVLSEQASTSGGDVSSHLRVPPAHKQGHSLTNTPLPDSPTLPIKHVNRVSNEIKRQRDSPVISSPSPRLPSAPKDQRPPMTPRTGSKKNILDLSINTELATRGRPKKITHRAIQPPTPSTLDTKQNPSIAEVMNSPLPVASPVSPTPSPLPSSNKKVAEIMDMFRRAYTSTQEITPHPTFETLQDAIVREINSHEAFQRVPVPEQGPPFTPSPSQDSFDQSATPPKPIPLKEGQRRRRMGSFKRHRRDSETRKSTSTIIPFNASRENSLAPSRRRHTDAPPPSPGFFDTPIPQFPSPPDDGVTYMDLLLQSENSIDTRRNRTTSITAGSGRVSTTPSVLCMRAQTTPEDSPRSFTNDDSDSDIIHLPSIEVPQVQIHGVDENNVTYTMENTTPRNAYRLINWPRKSGPNLSLRSTFTKNRTTSGQSVASY